MVAVVSEAAVIAGVLAIFGVLVGFLGWVALRVVALGEGQSRIEGKVDHQAAESAAVRHDLVTHMAEEIRVREAEQLEDRREREQRQAVIDGQFATLRGELSQGLRTVHERIDTLVERRRA